MVSNAANTPIHLFFLRYPALFNVSYNLFIVRSCKIVDWRNPEGLIEIDLEEKGWGDGRTVLLLCDGRSSNDFTKRLMSLSVIIC